MQWWQQSPVHQDTPRAPSQVPFKPGPEHTDPNQLKSPTLPSANTLVASHRAGQGAELVSLTSLPGSTPKEPAQDSHSGQHQLGHLRSAIGRPQDKERRAPHQRRVRTLLDPCPHFLQFSVQMPPRHREACPHLLQ